MTDAEKRTRRVPKRFADVEPDLTTYGAHGLYLFGDSGRGKSHMAAAIMLAHQSRGAYCSWLNVAKWLHDLHASYSVAEPPASVDFLVDSDLLVLDDLGRKVAKDGERNELYVLLNAAYDATTPLIITSNRTLEQLEAAIGDVLVSRIAEMCKPIAVSGIDRRVAR